MSTIGQRVFVLGGNQLYMTLANEEFVRPLGIGTNWTKIRIGILMAQTPDGTSNLPACTLGIGLCSGTTNPYGAATTTNFIGWSFANAGLFTYNAGSGNPYFTGPNGALVKRVGSTSTFQIQGGNINASTNTGAIQRRSLILTDIAKGSPNFTVSFTQSAAPTLDFTFTNLMDAMSQPANANSIIVAGVTFNGVTDTAFAFDENAGSLNTVDIFWSKPTFPMEIYAVAAFRMR